MTICLFCTALALSSTVKVLYTATYVTGPILCLCRYVGRVWCEEVYTSMHWNVSMCEFGFVNEYGVSDDIPMYQKEQHFNFVVTMSDNVLQ